MTYAQHISRAHKLGFKPLTPREYCMIVLTLAH